MKKLYVVTFWELYSGSNDPATQILPGEVFATKADAEAYGRAFGQKVEFISGRNPVDDFEWEWKRNNPKPGAGQRPVAPKRQDFAYLDDAAWADIRAQFEAAKIRHQEAVALAADQEEEWNQRLAEAKNAFVAANPIPILTEWERDSLHGDCYYELDEITISDERAAEIAAVLAA